MVLRLMRRLFPRPYINTKTLKNQHIWRRRLVSTGSKDPTKPKTQTSEKATKKAPKENGQSLGDTSNPGSQESAAGSGKERKQEGRRTLCEFDKIMKSPERRGKEQEAKENQGRKKEKPQSTPRASEQPASNSEAENNEEPYPKTPTTPIGPPPPRSGNIPQPQQPPANDEQRALRKQGDPKPTPMRRRAPTHLI